MKLQEKYTVSFVARGETYDKVKENGLTLLSPEHSNSQTYPNDIVQNISEIKNPDLVLICVKSMILKMSVNNYCQSFIKILSFFR